MLPKTLSSFTLSYYSSFIYGVLPFSYQDGSFRLSKSGLELWTCQICLTIAMNVKNYLDSLKNPCNNALSCAVYIQEVLNGITVEFQVLLLLYNRNLIKECLNSLVQVMELSKQICPLSFKNGKKITLLPVIYNIIFTTFTVGRCVVMFIIKPKSAFIEMVPFLCTVTQIQIENITVTLTYIAASNYKTLNNELDCCNTSKQLGELQVFHFKLSKFCKKIEKCFGLNITISVFTVLTQLLLMTFFETTLNIRPIKRNIMMNLYLILNILYGIVNLCRIAVVCKGCDLIHSEYRDTVLKLERMSLIFEEKCEDFIAQVQILKFRFTGCNLFYITMELVTEIVSVVSIYATTIVSFTTFSADTSAVYTSYVKKTV